MTPEWLTAIASVGTLIVIAASAVAAVFQLRHMRGSTQITALTEARETLESREFQEARLFIRSELRSLLKDSEIQRSVREVIPPISLYKASYVGNFFESLGAFVRNGIIDKEIACDLWSGVVYSSWQSLVPMTTIIRERQQGVWENFEYLAVLSKRYDETHPTSFPPHLERLPLVDELE